MLSATAQEINDYMMMRPYPLLSSVTPAAKPNRPNLNVHPANYASKEQLIATVVSAGLHRLECKLTIALEDAPRVTGTSLLDAMMKASKELEAWPATNRFCILRQDEWDKAVLDPVFASAQFMPGAAAWGDAMVIRATTSLLQQAFYFQRDAVSGGIIPFDPAKLMAGSLWVFVSCLSPNGARRLSWTDESAKT